MTSMHYTNTTEQAQQVRGGYYPNMDSAESISEPGKTHEALFTDKAGITKTYEAVINTVDLVKRSRQNNGIISYGKQK